MSTIRAKNSFLTDAVSPLVPFSGREGYRISDHTLRSGEDVPLVTVACSRVKLFEIFLESVATVGERFDFYLISDHKGRRVTRSNGDIESIILRSKAVDYESLLLHDGDTAVAVAAQDPYREVQLTCDKLILRFGKAYDDFLDMLEGNGIHRNEGMKMISDVEHRYHSPEGSYDRLIRFASDVGARVEKREKST